MGDCPVVEQEQLSGALRVAAFIRLEEMRGAEVLKYHDAAQSGQEPGQVTFGKGGT
jgi:hypothetical protein